MAHKKQSKHESEDMVDIGKEIFHFARKVPLWVWWVLVLVFGAFIFQAVFTSLSTIEYKGMTFTHEKMGEINFYHYTYYIDPTTKYNLYLRGDPRKNMIPIQENITFPSTKVDISVNTTGLASCEDSQVGIGQLSLFLAQNKLSIESASPDPVLAQQFNVTYASCVARTGATILVVQEGPTSEILSTGDGCYTLQVAHCEVIPVVEKFIINALIEARKRS